MRSCEGPAPVQGAGPRVSTRAKNDATTVSRPVRSIDLIRDGVQPRELRKGGEKALWLALGSTALNAMNFGWSRPFWELEVLDPRSKLGHQLRVDHHNKVRSERALRRWFDDAWERARQQYAKSPRWTPEEARAEAHQRARRLRELVALDDVSLVDVDRRLLRYAADLAEATGSNAVNLPQRATAMRINVGEKAVRLALDRLTMVGLLRIGQHGRPAKEPANRRANSYVLPDAETVAAYLGRETRQVRPNALTDTPSEAFWPTPPTGTDAPLRVDAPRQFTFARGQRQRADGLNMTR